MEPKLKDPAFVDKMAQFVTRLDEGLGLSARQHPDEAVKIVLDNDATGAQTEHHQTQMMGEINKLTEGTDGGARQGRLRSDGQDAAHRRLGSGHLEGTGRRLHDRGHRQGLRQVGTRPARSERPPQQSGGRSERERARAAASAKFRRTVATAASPAWLVADLRFRLQLL